MKTFTFDYTLPAEAEKMAHKAFMMCQDEEVKRLLEGTVMTLRQFLSQDNLVKDDDLADGLIKQSETFDDDQLDFIRDIFGNLITDSKNGYLKDKAKGVVHPLQEEELAIINVCQKQLGADEFESVEQFYRNKSNTWNEIIEEEDDNQD